MVDTLNTSEKSILAGLEQALDYANGSTKGIKKHKVKIRNVDVHKLRVKLGLSQDKFANAFGVSPATIRNWEQGRRQPQGPAKVLLNVIQQHPEAVLDSIYTQ